MHLSLLSVSLLFAPLGLFSHLVYFIYDEHHMQSVRILSAFTLGPPTIFALVLLTGDITVFDAIRMTAVASTSFFLALTVSILSYRMWLHPLRRFPGPLPARLTKLTHSLRLLTRSDNFAQTDRLHQKFGDIVRIGPNELSILDPDAIPAIHGSKSKCIKSAWYDAIAGLNPSLQTTRDRATHNGRRKLWDQAFSTKALREYECRILELVNELVAQLEHLEGQAVNASLWFNFYSFDVMGDLAFGQSFSMMKSQKQHFALKVLQAGMHSLGILTPIPWIFPILRKIPGAAKGLKMFTKYIEEQAEIRQKNPPQRHDITSWLLKEEKGTKTDAERQRRWLYGDTGLMIVAGSDTASAVITHVIYHLAKDPGLAMKLREELKTAAPSDAKLLSAIINETLRLHPPIPSGVLRQTPSAGLMIKNTFIPGGVIISTPTWSLGRLASAFSKPNEFIPERWTSAPELVKDKTAFIPFSSGPYSCIGKNLALLSIRMVVARIVLHFDIFFGVSETGEGLLKDTRDVFTLEVAPLYLNFVKRREEDAL